MGESAGVGRELGGNQCFGHFKQIVILQNIVMSIGELKLFNRQPMINIILV